MSNYHPLDEVSETTVLVGRIEMLSEPEIAFELYETDPAGDAAWFATHPGIDSRWRPIVPEEVAAFKLPPTITVLVELYDGHLSRLYHDPARVMNDDVLLTTDDLGDDIF